MAQWDIPLLKPTKSEETTPFWEGTEAGELRVQQCEECGSRQLPASPVCVECLSPKVSWVATSGRGTIFSYTVIHHNDSVPFREMLPYIVALVDLEEGARVTSNILECTPEVVHVGMPVEVVYEEINDEVTLPQFRPVLRTAS